MQSGWTVQLIAASDGVQLEYLGPSVDDWYGDGTAGCALGRLAHVIEVAGGPADPEWLQAACVAVRGEAERGASRVGLVVSRGRTVMFHATRSVNRESVRRYGLDWTRMVARGIAGSVAPEHHGTFLCAAVEDARWFAAMARDEPADIWEVDVDGLWLISDPNSSGGLDDSWAIATDPIGPSRVRLFERDVTPAGAD